MSPESCYSRSQSITGSSKNWSPWLSTFWLPEGAGFYGLMDANATNPFGSWSLWIAYCDGSSFTSDADQPIVYNNTNLYMRGRAILDATLDELETAFGFLSQASEVIISGTSAGGMATYLHTSYIKSRLSAGTRVVAMPDAGFFLDHPAYTNGVRQWYNSVATAIQPSFWNSTLQAAGARCLADLAPKGRAAACYLPQYIYPYLTDIDGVFILQSLYDTAQLGICYSMGCNLYTTCNASEVAAIDQYHTDLLTNITAVVQPFAQRDGYFLTSCYQHEESCRARDWYGITIGGQTANSTFYNWYAHGVNSNSVRVDVAWPGDSSCAPQGFDHGAC